MQRLLGVADNSLILGAIAIGLRESGEFKRLGHIDERTPSPRAIVDAAPDVLDGRHLGRLGPEGRSEPRYKGGGLLKSRRCAGDLLGIVS